MNFFSKNFITIINMNFRSKYLQEIIKFTSKNIELKLPDWCRLIPVFYIGVISSFLRNNSTTVIMVLI